MQFLANGKVMFNDIYEMYYHLFTEMGLSINKDGYLYDQETMIVLRYKDKFIKATVQPIEIYAGRTDIIFDPAHNYHLMTTLFGYYLDKERNNPEGDRIQYLSQFIDDNKARDKQRLVVKTAHGDISSQYYYNIYLAFIECVFALSDNFNVDLSNFDVELF